MLSASLSIALALYQLLVPSPFYIALLAFAFAGNALTEEMKRHRKRVLVVVFSLFGLLFTIQPLSQVLTELWGLNL